MQWRFLIKKKYLFLVAFFLVVLTIIPLSLVEHSVKASSFNGSDIREIGYEFLDDGG